MATERGVRCDGCDVVTVLVCLECGETPLCDACAVAGPCSDCIYEKENEDDGDGGDDDDNGGDDDDE